MTARPDDEAALPEAVAGTPHAAPVASQPAETLPMEIHKPHAAKTWREFFIEIGTIVTGILIALALEQIVDGQHKREERREATENIHAEFEQAMSLIHNRDRVTKCIDARLDELQKVLSDSIAGKPLAGPTWVGTPPRWIMPVARWDFTASAGRLSLLLAKDQETYADLHRRIVEINDALVQEQSDWAQLRVFEHDPRITPQQGAMIGAALQDARYRTHAIAIALGRADGIAANLGIRATATSNLGVAGICMGFPVSVEEARKKMGDR